MSLPKIPDRNVTYYKITNKKECHNGLQYKDGLIIDPIKFNNDPNASCVKGGIYFTTKGEIHNFFSYGKWIRPVVIPDDAKVVLDLEGDKYRSNKLLFHPRENMGFYFDKLFDKKIFPKKDYWCIAWWCYNYFNKWFDKDIFPENSYWTLSKYCSDKFDIWFDKRTFPKSNYWSLAEYCTDKFDIWFDKRTFPKEYYIHLANYCQKYKNIWSK